MDDLIKDAPGGAGDGRFIHGAVLEGVGHLLGIQLSAKVAEAAPLGNRFFGNVAAEHGHHLPQRGIGGRAWRRRRRQWLHIEERGNREAAGARLWLARHLHVQTRIDEVDPVNRAPV